MVVSADAGLTRLFGAADVRGRCNKTRLLGPTLRQYAQSNRDELWLCPYNVSAESQQQNATGLPWALDRKVEDIAIWIIAKAKAF